MVRDLRRGRAHVGERGDAGDDHRGAGRRTAGRRDEASAASRTSSTTATTGFLVAPGATRTRSPSGSRSLAADPERARRDGRARARARVLERYAVGAARRRRRRALPHAARRATTAPTSGAVAAEGDLAVGLALDPGPAARAHPVERRAALVRVADHPGDQLGAARRDDDAAADLARRSARSRCPRRRRRSPAGRRRGSRTAGSARRSRRALARARRSGGPPAESDSGAARAAGTRGTRTSSGLEPPRERDELHVARAEADDHDAQVVEVAQERRRADERVEVLRVTDVAGVHDDERRRRAVLARPGVVARLRRDRRRVDPVRDHADPIGRGALLLQPAAASSRRSRRRGRRARR